MKASFVKIVPLLVVSLFLAAAGTFPTYSNPGVQVDPPRNKRRNMESADQVLSYRSRGARHKLLIPTGSLSSRVSTEARAIRSRNFGSYTLVEIADDLASLSADTLENVQVRDDMNLILLKKGQIDTTGPTPQIREDLRQPDDLHSSLHLIQLFGPPTAEALAAVKASGARIVSYVPNNAYLVWTTASQLSRIRRLKGDSGFIQWDGPFHPAYKIGDSININSVEQIPAAVQLVDGDDLRESLLRVKGLAREILSQETHVAGTVLIRVLIDSNRLPEIARLPEVVGVERWARPRLKDERASQIVAGPLLTETVNSALINRPSTPGYLSFLKSNGFASGLDFIIDVADTGFDLGLSSPGRMHPDFLDAAGQSRVAYLNDYTGDYFNHLDDGSLSPAHDPLGHGTMNASVLAGSSTADGSQYVDAQGYRYGLGVVPFARIGISKIFTDDSVFGNFSYENMISNAYTNGARISSNSWGLCDPLFGVCNFYNADARVFDSLVRDAVADQPGNQEMIVVFSAGNEGAALSRSINMPGTAKNVITVGASESFRPMEFSPTDLCEVPASAADNALDLVIFSSGGRTRDGRAKPDLVAPGTNLVGAASQDQRYASRPAEELQVCDRYFPAGQTLYTLSSGTSQSTPIVAGGAALALQWLKNRSGVEPSPALVKAFVLNSTTYMNGHLGGGNLPGARQGWGLMNLSRMFEPTDRIIYDQSPSRTFTESGGSPFETSGVITDPSKEFRVMLVWTDPPGDFIANAPYVNQLNLEVEIGGVVYQANNFSGQYSVKGGNQDLLNNVQGIRLPAGTTGPFVVRVRPAVIAGDGVPGNGLDLDQDFALVVTNGRETALPLLAISEDQGISPDVTVKHANGTVDHSLIPDETVTLSVPVLNRSKTATADAAAATLSLGGENSNSTYPQIAPQSSAANAAPFQLRVPAGLQCGAVAQLQLTMGTGTGPVTIPVRLRVGRQSGQKTILTDDVDSGRVRWKFKQDFAASNEVASSGTRSYRAVDTGQDDKPVLASMTSKKKISIPANAGAVRLSFSHSFNFEPGFDGGVVEISTDGGASWQDLGSRMIVGGYDGQVPAVSQNPLGDRLAWTARGIAGVFRQVVINLDDFAGQKVSIRFLAGFDETTGISEGYRGWFIDDIQITANLYECK